jgi:hypothetical protein
MYRWDKCVNWSDDGMQKDTLKLLILNPVYCVTVILQCTIIASVVMRTMMMYCRLQLKRTLCPLLPFVLYTP